MRTGRPATQQQVPTDHGTTVSHESLPTAQGTRRNRRSRQRMRSCRWLRI